LQILVATETQSSWLLKPEVKITANHVVNPLLIILVLILLKIILSIYFVQI